MTYQRHRVIKGICYVYEQRTVSTYKGPCTDPAHPHSKKAKKP